MDIHPPGGPTHSFKDFLIHILIVTIGILIALGLEGVRETWRERKAVAEAREGFQRELLLDRGQLRMELANVKQVNHGLDRVLTDYSILVKSPDELGKQIGSIGPSFYFFRTTAWEAAIASGALAHMSPDEINRFADVYLSVKNYQDAQKSTIPAWIAMRTFFRSHHRFSPAEEEAGEERLRTFQAGMQTMEHLGGEFEGGLRSAIGGE